MIQHSHQTAPTQFVDVAGVRFAYRRLNSRNEKHTRLAILLTKAPRAQVAMILKMRLDL